MFTILVTVVILTLLYGLAWHDKPASQPERVRHSEKPGTYE